MNINVIDKILPCEALKALMQIRRVDLPLPEAAVMAEPLRLF